jgi:hypothetical protein
MSRATSTALIDSIECPGPWGIPKIAEDTVHTARATANRTEHQLIQARRSRGIKVDTRRIVGHGHPAGRAGSNDEALGCARVTQRTRIGRPFFTSGGLAEPMQDRARRPGRPPVSTTCARDNADA